MVTKAKTTKAVSKKTTAPKKELTPLEKARLARASGKTTKKRTKAKKIVFKAPEGFKPFFAILQLRIDKDGLLTDLNLVRQRGKEGSKTYLEVPFSVYDPATLTRFAIRAAGPMFVRNQARRLTAGSVARVVLRVGNHSERGLSVRVREIKFREGTDGKLKLLERKDPRFRAIRKFSNFANAAFTKALPLPSNKELKELFATEAE